MQSSPAAALLLLERSVEGDFGGTPDVPNATLPICQRYGVTLRVLTQDIWRPLNAPRRIPRCIRGKFGVRNAFSGSTHGSLLGPVGVVATAQIDSTTLAFMVLGATSLVFTRLIDAASDQEISKAVSEFAAETAVPWWLGGPCRLVALGGLRGEVRPM